MLKVQPEDHDQLIVDRRRRMTLIFIGWLTFIFLTSCTVVRPQEFFGLIEYFTGFQAGSMRTFQAFWAAGWILFVKGWHFTEFAVLTGLCAAAIRWKSGSEAEWPIYVAMVFCAGYAVSDEWHQSFVPDRRGTIDDVVID